MIMVLLNPFATDCMAYFYVIVVSILRTSLFIAFTLIIVLLMKISTHYHNVYQINIETSYFMNIYLYLM